MRHLTFTYFTYLRRLKGNISSFRRLASMDHTNGKSGRIAVCQMTSGADRAANLAVVTKLISNASKENVQMIFFPEACDYICDNKKEVLSNSEPIIGGATVNSYRDLAIKHNVWLSMGGLHEKDPSNPSKVFNTHIIIDNAGQIVQSYRKIHLFDVEIPEKKVRLKESDLAMGGQHIVTPVKSPVGNIGLAICYDLRFPELSTQLVAMGSDVLTYPSAFTYATGEAHWETLLRARAIENQCYVVAAAQVGQHNPKRRSYGHGLCVDPWGVVLADCGESEGYAIAQISLEKLRSTRINMPVFQHRRNDVYSLYCHGLRNKPLPEHQDSTAEGSAGKVLSRDVSDELYEGTIHQFGHCKIRESCVFYKTDLTYAFVNLRCVVPGHVLVAPRRNVQRNRDLTEAEAEDFFRTVVLVQKLMEYVHGAKSATVTIQDGPDAGRTVEHLHCHIMPRKPGDFKDNDLIYLELAKHDRLTTDHPIKPARTNREMEEEAAHLRGELEKLQLATS